MCCAGDLRQSRMLVWWVWRSAGRGQPSSLARRTAVSAGLWTRAQEENMEPDMRMTRWKCACRIMGLCTRYSTLAAPTPCTTVTCLMFSEEVIKQANIGGIWQNSRNNMQKAAWYCKQDVASAHQQYDLHEDGDQLVNIQRRHGAWVALSVWERRYISLVTSSTPTWPISVILVLSPPNCSTFSPTHCRAAIWSTSP